MARTKRTIKNLPTIWRADDKLWNEFIHPVIMKLDPPKATGRPRIAARQAFDGAIYQMRTGCQWNHLPKTFGSDRSIHRTFQRWIRLGVLDEILASVIDHCDELDDVDWLWQSADGALAKARLGGIMSGKTPPIAVKMARNAA